MPLVSIIVPIFKVKREYVICCLDSIRQQTYPNIEVWLIDDGNEEDYAAWLDTFACKNIFIHHQRNKGVSAARNVGIELAKGEYVCFCDPDDIMHVREVEILVNHALEHNADIAVGAYQKFKGSDSPDIFSNFDAREVLLYQEEELQNVMLDLVAIGRESILHGKKLSGKYAVCSPWGHIYRRESLYNTRFHESLYAFEDILFNICVLENIKKIVFVDAALHYYRRGYGITARFQNRARENNARFYEEKIHFLSKRDWEADISNELYKTKIIEVGANMRSYFFHPDNPKPKKEILRELFEFIRDETCLKALKQISNPYYTGKQRILCVFLFCLNKVDAVLSPFRKRVN